MNNEPENISVTLSEKLPGKLLKETRDSIKMTPEEVAERLHLPVRVIKALENDKYEMLPGITYIQGYLRSYASLLNIPFSSVSIINNKYADVSLLVPESINYANEPNNKKMNYLWVTLSLLLALLILSGILQLGAEDEVVAGVIENDDDIQAKIINSSEKVSSDTKVVNQAEQIDENIIVEQPVETKAITINKNESNEKFDGLVLNYRKSSWTEVYDLNGKKLVYGMIDKGEKIQVEGLQPYSILLGDAKAVNVEFEGKTYSHGKYTRNGRAQFVIGSSYNN